jgi:arsenical pump membrane protein
MPALAAWLRLFILPSLLSVAATYLVLKLLFRADLRCRVAEDVPQEMLSIEGRRAAWGILAMGAVLIGASAFGRDLGLPACVAALCAVLWTTRARLRSVVELVREIPWSVLPLVAGLFVIVEALNRAGALTQFDRGLSALLTVPSTAAALSASLGIALLSNVMNNLPSGLLVGGALHSLHVPGYLRHALLIGVDLGPNLSVTGSLATILWLIVLRREGLDVSGPRFLKAGVLVMPPALLLATAALALTAGN